MYRRLGEALLLDFPQDLDGPEVLAEDAGLDAGVIFEAVVEGKRKREGVAGQLVHGLVRGVEGAVLERDEGFGFEFGGEVIIVAGLDAIHAVEAAVEGAETFGEGEFEFADGAEGILPALESSEEFFLGFPESGDNVVDGIAAVFDSVTGGAEFALRGFGAG